MPQITDQATIAANVRAAKARRRVTDAEIAEATGISRSGVNDRLNGKARIQLDELQALAAFLQTPIDTLLAPAEEVA